MELGGGMILLWQLLITSEMIGLEANISLEVILMIANIQTLGVPVRYSSVPGLVAAAAGVFLIPILGYVLDRWAKSKQSKAKILAFTTAIQFTGSFLVLLANGLKLALTSAEDDINNGSNSINLTDLNLDQITSRAGYNSTNLLSISPWSNTLNTSAFNFSLHTGSVNKNEHSLQVLNESFPFYLRKGLPVDYHINSSIQLPTTYWTSLHTGPQEEVGAIPFYAYIAMVGYALLDCGYDSSVCFLKTFVLHCTPMEYHTSVIVKSILVSSVGGVFVSILGSIDLGQKLTAGTNLDGSSALACLLSALTNLLLVCGTVATFTTGFCWKPPANGGKDDSPYGNGEKRLLVSSTSLGPDFNDTQHRSKQNAHQSYTHSKFLASASMTIEREQVVDAVKLDEPYQPGVRGFLRRQRKQILVNLSAFFLLSSLYSFEVFTVNFLGTSVFGGDPAASVGSVEYQRYLNGVAVGSQGTLIFYITFAISSLLHEKFLAFFGWKMETIVSSFIYAALCMASAITKELWVFYIVAVWTGIFRAIAVAVPYILANQISAEENGGKSSGTAIALVAAMLPCGFVVCSAIMGPLIDFTGTASVSMFYSAVTAFLGCITIAFLKL